jgi:predicted nucleic acid-binding protein
MRIIVDANIIFSAILNTDGKIGDVLLNSHNIYEFIAPRFLKDEIRKYQKKILLISGYSNSELLEVEDKVYKPISFISEVHIPLSIRVSSEHLVKDIDPKDVAYVAFAKYFRCKLWSGDKALRNGLVKKGFTNIINTDELFKLRENKISKK